jgi:hypothetical protein
MSPQQTYGQPRGGCADNPLSFWMVTERFWGVFVPGREADETAMRHFLLDAAEDTALLPVESFRAKDRVGIGSRHVCDLVQEARQVSPARLAQAAALKVLPLGLCGRGVQADLRELIVG